MPHWQKEVSITLCKRAKDRFGFGKNSDMWTNSAISFSSIKNPESEKKEKENANHFSSNHDFICELLWPVASAHIKINCTFRYNYGVDNNL